MMTFIDILNFFPQHHVFSFVGGGGKSTTIYLMAEEFSAAGGGVLVTTTTKMYHPNVRRRPYNRFSTGPVETIFEGRERKDFPGITVAARRELPTGKYIKLEGFLPEEISKIWELHLFDLILVEADGARHLPIKAPGDKEPVIPEITDIIFGVVGLDILGKRNLPINVFRPEKFSLVSGTKEGEVITSESIAKLAYSEAGLFKSAPIKARKIVVLNKADNEKLLAKGFETAQSIFTRDNPPDKVIITSGIKKYKSTPVRGVMDKEKPWTFLRKQQI